MSMQDLLVSMQDLLERSLDSLVSMQDSLERSLDSLVSNLDSLVNNHILVKCTLEM